MFRRYFAMGAGWLLSRDFSEYHLKHLLSIRIPLTTSRMRRFVAGVVVIAMLGGGVATWLLFPSSAYAATYTWSQTDWSGGAAPTTYPVHPTNQAAWNQYSSKDSTVAVGSGALSLTAQAGSVTQSTTADIQAGALNYTSLTDTAGDGSISLTGMNDFAAGNWDGYGTSSTGPANNNGFCSAVDASNNNLYVVTWAGGNLTRYSTTSHAWTARTSMGTVTWCSIVYPGTGDYIYGTRNGSVFSRYSITGNSWSTMTAPTGTIATGSQTVVSDGSDYIYVLGASGGTFYRYSISGNSWSTLTASGTSFGTSSSLTYPGSGDYLYATHGSGSNALSRYSISGNSWSSMATSPSSFGHCGQISAASTSAIYAVRGGGNTDTWKYDVSGNSWAAVGSAPLAVGTTSSCGSYFKPLTGADAGFVMHTGLTGSSSRALWHFSISKEKWLAASISTIGSSTLTDIKTSSMSADQAYIYVAKANSIYRYSISSDTWTTVATNAPVTISDAYIFQPTASDLLYVMSDWNVFYTYSISTTVWTALTGVGTSVAVSLFDAIYAPGTDYIYALGSISGSTTLRRYSISGNSWSTLTAPGVSSTTHRLLYSGSGDYMYSLMGSTNSLRRYSISGNSWSAMSSPSSTSAIVNPGITPSGDAIYAVEGQKFYVYTVASNTWTQPSNVGANISWYHRIHMPSTSPYGFLLSTGTDMERMYRYAYKTGYYSSGTYTSAAINTSTRPDFSTIAWSATVPSGTSVSWKVRSASSSLGLSSATFEGPTSSSDSYTTAAGQTLAVTHDAASWIQLQATLTSDGAQTLTPTLDSVTVNYQYYPSSASLISSAYNTSDPSSVLSKIQWSATTPSETSVSFQLATAPDSAGSPGTFGGWVGPDGTSGTYFTASNGSVATPAAVSDSVDDQWFKYKVFLATSNGTVTPTLNDVTATYVVNALPDFNADYPTTSAGGVGLTQNADGTFTIGYSVRDIDTTTGTANPGYIVPTFEYSLNNGSSWASIPSDKLSALATGNQSVNEVAYTTHTAVWSSTEHIPGQYSTTAKVRVKAYDNEVAGRYTAATSQAFTLDTTAPVGGSPAITIAGGAPKTRVQTVAVTLSVTDASSLQMQISENEDFGGSSYVAYATSTDFNLSNGEGLKTLYVRFKDSFGNVSPTYSDSITYDVTPPDVPVSMQINDVSNEGVSDFRLFISWEKSVASDFESYQVFRSVDGGGFTLYQTITDAESNFLFDTGLSDAETYGYKVKAVDDISNESAFGDTVSRQPTVQPGDITAPVITDVSTSSVGAQSVTVTWTSDESATSEVQFDAAGTFGLLRGVAGYGTFHSVVLTGLTPGNLYTYRVKSCDSAGNCQTSVSDTVETLTEDVAGPIISDAEITTITKDSAMVAWTTSEASTSIVEYSVVNGFSAGSGTTFGSTELVLNHEVTLPAALGENTTYWLRIHSQDALGNETVSDQMSFTTLSAETEVSDTTAPALQGLTAQLIADQGVTIAWTSNEKAFAKLRWGLSPVLGQETEYGSEATLSQSVVLKNLQPSTTYYVVAVSKDEAGNESTIDKDGSPLSITTLASPGEDGTYGLDGTELGKKVSEAFLKKFFEGLASNGNITESTYIEAASQAAGRIVAAPLITGINAEVALTPRTATIRWTTNKDANALVAFATEAAYKATAENPYGEAAGSTDEYSTDHTVILSGLEPDTTYHFRLRSQGLIGPASYSDDAVFTTPALNPELLDVRFMSISDTAASLTWQSEMPTKAVVTTTNVQTNQSQVATIQAFTKKHVLTIEDLLPSTNYTLNIQAEDEEGHKASEVTLPFSSLAATEAPRVSQVQFSTSLAPDRADVTMTAITWRTDKPGTSRVYYAEGGATELTEGTTTSKELSRDHIVVTNALKPGKIYRLQVESTDAGGKSTRSQIFTLQTPKPRASVIDLIFSSLNQTFGFLNR